MSNLTARQRKFAEVYDGNGADACRKAGYRGSVQALSTQAARLLKNAEVVAVIRKREEKQLEKPIASREQRQAFWTATMNDEEKNDFVRLKASELLGKSQADFTEKVEHSGTVTLLQVIDPYAQKPKVAK